MQVGASLMGSSIEKLGTWRFLPLIGCLLLCGLIGLTGFFLAQSVTSGLLKSEARIDGQMWADYLLRNTDGLVEVAAGKSPSAATREPLRQAGEIGRIYSFRIYDSRGQLKLSSEYPAKTPNASQAIEDMGARIAAASSRPQTMTFLHTARNTGDPSHYASTMVPITSKDGSAVGWLVANIDQSDRYELISQTVMIAALVMGCLLLIAAILGFWFHARQRAFVEHKLETLALHDQLTGLQNKSSFLSRISRHLSTAGDSGKHCALIVCEIADIDLIDQNFGQESAENVILMASQRLQNVKLDTGEIARLERSRLGLFVHSVTDPMAVLSLAKDLTAKLSEPIVLNGESIAIQAHAGIGLSSSDGSDAAALLRSTELALRSAQEQGTPGYGFFNPEIAQDVRRRVAVQKAVADAVLAHSFRLDFQPIYAIRTGELNGFEALIRLHDAELGAISPVEFIPIAEQAGLINKIGAWCLQEACRVAVQWPAHLIVAVNLSPWQFYSGSLIADVRNALDQNQFPSYRLEVEITEGTLLKDSELVMQQLRVLRDMGVAVALDDFGTGYSSLSYLWKFPFSKLKIDRGFVQALDETQSARGILRSIVKLGHGLGLTVTAEGIESTKQYTVLRDLGCDLAQGFLLDRPARVADLAAIILRNFANGLNRRNRETTMQEPVEPTAKSGSSAA